MDSLSHTKWNCKYHLVFAPKYRRQAIYGKVKEDIGRMLRKLCEYKGIDLGQDSAKLKDRTFYLISIKNFTIKNISETNIIMCGVMIDKLYYPFDSKIILESGESCSVCTTKNVCVNLAEEISEIFLVVQDVLQNFYCLNCRIESNVNVTMPYLTTRIHDEEYTGFRMDYQINSIELPALLTKEPTNE